MAGCEYQISLLSYKLILHQMLINESVHIYQPVYKFVLVGYFQCLCNVWLLATINKLAQGGGSNLA